MTFPSDWPQRWWLRPGDVAALLRAEGRPTTRLVFVGDDGGLWDFRLGDAEPSWDHTGDFFAGGLDDQPTINAFASTMRKLTGGRPRWELSADEQLILDTLAGANLTAGWVSRRKLRRLLGDIDLKRFERIVDRLQPRYVEQTTGHQGPEFKLTFPGLLRSREGRNTEDLIGAAVRVLRRQYDADTDVESYLLDEVLNEAGLPEARTPFINAVLRLSGLARGERGIPQGAEVRTAYWVPAEIESIVDCRGPSDFFELLREGKTECPWPTAPLRLEDVLLDIDRARRVGELARPPTRGATQGMPHALGVQTRTVDSGSSQWSRHHAQAGNMVAHLAAEALAAPTNSPARSQMKYDVALSFAGEDRAHAEALYGKLTDAGFTVFYDEAEQATLWGVNLVEHLYDVYCNKARFCVMFVSEAYAAKLWTTHERRAAQERAFKEPRRAYILPVRIDDAEVPGLPSTVAYISIERGIDEIARLLVQKLSGA